LWHGEGVSCGIAVAKRTQWLAVVEEAMVEVRYQYFWIGG
jgi:hypothetical protein